MSTEIIQFGAYVWRQLSVSDIQFLIIIACFFLTFALILFTNGSSRAKSVVNQERKQKVSDSEDNSDSDEEEEAELEDDDPIKMVLVIRTDLKMSSGKVAAQCCHGCLAAYLSSMERSEYTRRCVRKWMFAGQTKVTLKCSSEEEMVELYDKARKSGLVSEVIQDAGRTQIAPGSMTVLALGPDKSSKINEICSHLKLY